MDPTWAMEAEYGARMGFQHYESDSLIEREIAGYRITGYLNAGAHSLVYRATRARLSLTPPDHPSPAVSQDAPSLDLSRFPSEVAIKLLTPAPGTREEEVADVRRRFEREAATLRRLTHPHVLPLIDAGWDAPTGCPYMILPYMERGSLTDVLARYGQPPLEVMAALLARMAAALDYAHAQGVIHRDVKPGNILLDAEGVARLGDFGLARLFERDMTDQTTLGRVMGSPSYMAPEQFSETERVGPLTDIYGLGMVAYQLVTGRVAFEADSLHALLYKQLYEAPVSPRRMRSELPEPAAVAIMQALAKEPARRFASGAAFADALTRGIQGEWAEELSAYAPTRTFLMRLAPAVRAAAQWRIPAIPEIAEVAGDWRAGVVSALERTAIDPAVGIVAEGWSGARAALAACWARACDWADWEGRGAWQDARYWMSQRSLRSARGALAVILVLVLLLAGIVDLEAHAPNRSSLPQVNARIHEQVGVVAHPAHIERPVVSPAPAAPPGHAYGSHHPPRHSPRHKGDNDKQD